MLFRFLILLLICAPPVSWADDEMFGEGFSVKGDDKVKVRGGFFENIKPKTPTPVVKPEAKPEAKSVGKPAGKPASKSVEKPEKKQASPLRTQSNTQVIVKPPSRGIVRKDSGFKTLESGRGARGPRASSTLRRPPSKSPSNSSAKANPRVPNQDIPQISFYTSVKDIDSFNRNIKYLIRLEKEGSIRIKEVVLFDFMKSYAVAHDMRALADPFYHWPRKGEKPNEEARLGKLFLLRIEELKSIGLSPKEGLSQNLLRGLDLPLAVSSSKNKIIYEDRVSNLSDSLSNNGGLASGRADRSGLFANLSPESRTTTKEGNFGLVYKRRAYDKPPLWLRK